MIFAEGHFRPAVGSHEKPGPAPCGDGPGRAREGQRLGCGEPLAGGADEAGAGAVVDGLATWSS